MKTQQEINEFLTSTDLTIDSLDVNQSFKTNLMVIKNNTLKIVSYIKNLKSFVKNLYQTIDINVIINSVLNNLQTTKVSLPINVTLNIGLSEIFTLGLINYKIERTNDKQITITKESDINWDTSKIMVCIKDFNGTIVYPVINTLPGKIIIYFNDNISTNYQAILL